jgi:hypothetical protein
MQRDNLFSTLAVAAVILITAGFLVAVEPEESSINSEDGVVTVTGLARQTQPLSIRSNTAVAAPLLGSSYLVSPAGVTLDEPAVIAFSILDDQQAQAAMLGVYRFHAQLEMWEPVAPVVANTDELLAVETSQLGEFAIGDVPVFETPVFANVYDQLRSMAPVNAVGYETAVAFTEKDHEIIRLLSSGENGGCGGTVRVGDGESVSRLEREAVVEIEDQQVPLAFVFVTRWFTSSSGGCQADELLSPLSEYDILDEIQT